jgi:hypothetical protein
MIVSCMPILVVLVACVLVCVDLPMLAWGTAGTKTELSFVHALYVAVITANIGLGTLVGSLTARPIVDQPCASVQAVLILSLAGVTLLHLLMPFLLWGYVCDFCYFG